MSNSPRVSIPFKRESLSKVSQYPQLSALNWFQFPSNGKPYPKKELSMSKHRYGRIGFNSLQTGNPIQSKVTQHGNDYKVSFNSLQTGNPIQRDSQSAEFGVGVTVSIPFKRETLSKVHWTEAEMRAQNCIVSIPFKRETLSKVNVLNAPGGVKISFNSLQTGNPIQSHNLHRITVQTD